MSFATSFRVASGVFGISPTQRTSPPLPRQRFASTPRTYGLEQLDQIYGSMPKQSVGERPVTKPVVVVEDNGPIHFSNATMAAFKAREHELPVEWLPKYAPELNDIEVALGDFKVHHLAHQTSDNPEELDQAIHDAAEN